MIEDLTGNIRRVCEGIAIEATKRIMSDCPQCNEAVVRSHINQVLLDWFLGEFRPENKRN